jgi:hypothetical protein
MGEFRHAYSILVAKHGGRRPFGIPRLRWEDNTKRNLKEVRCAGVDSIHLTQDRDQWWAVVNTVMDH